MPSSTISGSLLISGDSPENKKKHRVEMRMIKKSSLNAYVDCVMSNGTRYQCERPYEEMLKVIDGRDILDITCDKHIY